MPLLRTIEKQVLKRKNQFSVPAIQIHLIDVFACDFCNTEVERPIYQRKNKKFVFCSKTCQANARKEGGCLNYIYSDMKLEAESKGQKWINTSDEIREKIKRTCLKKFGVENPLHCPKIRQQCQNTMMLRYGVKFSMQSSEIRAKFPWQNAQRKRHETMKKLGLYGKSQAEDKFYNLLTAHFDDVERSILVNENRWPIDFYVPSIQTYIQFDGDYWHGLDRPLEEILLFKHKRDKTIYQKWVTDREQEKWFAEQNLKLIRIKESEFNDFFAVSSLSSQSK